MYYKNYKNATLHSEKTVCDYNKKYTGKYARNTSFYQKLTTHQASLLTLTKKRQLHSHCVSLLTPITKMENNNQITTNYSSCYASLPFDSRHRTCQACRERVAASRHRRHTEEQEEGDIITRPRGRPRANPVEHVPAAYISQLSRLHPLNIGRMDKECPHCHVPHWIDERQETSSLRNPSWELCCKQSLVQLPLLAQPPRFWKDLLTRADAVGCQFKNKLRQYNIVFTDSL